MMKKLLLFVAVAGTGALLAGAVFAGGAERPRGLEDKGPLTKLTFIHYQKDGGPAKPPWAGGGGGGKGKPCYAFLAKGARWRVTEPFFVNPVNEDGAGQALVLDAVDAAVEAWDSQVAFDLFGTRWVDETASYNDGALDGVNTISFGAYPDPGVIAVTTVWGYFYGPPKTREIVEWDILLNEFFDWGDASLDPAKMDLQNILTHEQGHAAGLDDLYDADCSEETMYGYSQEGETQKRSLEAGDIEGIQKLYG